MDDYMDDGRDAAGEAAHHELMLERERETVEALRRCAKAGARPEDLKTLARECGIDPKFITIGEANASH